MTNEPTTCPVCHADFSGEPIPEADREHFGGATHFLRVVAVTHPGEDFARDWLCPDCGHTWPRRVRS